MTAVERTLENSRLSFIGQSYIFKILFKMCTFTPFWQRECKLAGLFIFKTTI